MDRELKKLVGFIIVGLAVLVLVAVSNYAFISQILLIFTKAAKFSLAVTVIFGTLSLVFDAIIIKLIMGYIGEDE